MARVASSRAPVDESRDACDDSADLVESGWRRSDEWSTQWKCSILCDQDRMESAELSGMAKPAFGGGILRGAEQEVAHVVQGPRRQPNPGGGIDEPHAFPRAAGLGEHRGAVTGDDERVGEIQVRQVGIRLDAGFPVMNERWHRELAGERARESGWASSGSW